VTVGETWSSLFHHVLQDEATLTPERAAEALVLIDWMFARHRDYCAEQGYEVDAALATDVATVKSALSAKANEKDTTPDWPWRIIAAWEHDKPFHEAVGSRRLASDWDSLYRVLENQSKYRRHSCLRHVSGRQTNGKE